MIINNFIFKPSMILSLEQENKVKACKTCFKEKEKKDFPNDCRNDCKACISERRKISDSKRIIINPSEKECRICKNVKPIEIFTKRDVKNNIYRNECKDCTSKISKEKKYYVKSRQKKIEEDHEGWKKHNREVHRKWVEKNYEKHSQDLKNYYKTTNGKMSSYRNRVENENKEDFNLWSGKLFEGICFYCGADENIGIDRLNSNISYIEENCVSCCSTCNMIKKSMDMGSFLQKVRDIAVYNKLTEFEKYNFVKSNLIIGNSSSYSDYKNRSIKMFQKFEITKEEFKEITQKDCYLCGSKNDKGIGIDRVDNNTGYKIENCKSCCSYCNFMKRNYIYEFFLKHIQKITHYSTKKEHLDISELSEFTSIMKIN